jgi:WD40 repeat protein
MVLKCHGNLVGVLSWSPTGSLASTLLDNTVRIWDPSGQEILVIEKDTFTVRDLAWSHDGTQIASASRSSNTVRIWDLSTGSCIATLEMEYPGHLYFDRFDSNKIHTGSGTFILGHRAQDEPVEETFNNMSISSSPQQEEYGLIPDGVFLTYKGRISLRIPPEYRPSDPSLLGMCGTTMAIDCQAVGLLVLKLAEDPHFQVK